MKMKLLFLITTLFLLLPVLGYTQANEVPSDATHKGDIIVEGIDTYVIANCTFVQKGSIIVMDFATLIIENANLTIEQDWGYQCKISIENKAKMKVQNATIDSNYNLDMYWNTFSEVNFTAVYMTKSISVPWTFNPRINITNSTIEGQLSFVNDAQIYISDSKISYIWNDCCHPDLWIQNSTIDKMDFGGGSETKVEPKIWGVPTANITNSMIKKLYCFLKGTIRVFNSQIEDITFRSGSTVEIYISWWLTVVVTVNGQSFQGATVEVFYSHNGRLAISGVTETSGKVKFALAEKIVNSTATEYVGNYTVKASCEKVTDQKDVVLTEDRELIISLTDVIEPNIVFVSHSPQIPKYNETVTVTASVTDYESGINIVILSYHGGISWQNLTMTLEEGLYGATIPALPYNTTVQYKVYAKDNFANWNVTGAYSYTVTDTYPPLAFVTPAKFEVSNLLITPTEVLIGETVSVSVDVINSEDVTGTYDVTLKIDGMVEETREVTLVAGGSETITFTVTRDLAGTYNIEVDGLMGAFKVTAPPRPLIEPWLPYIGAAVTIIVVSVMAAFLIKRMK